MRLRNKDKCYLVYAANAAVGTTLLYFVLNRGPGDLPVQLWNTGCPRIYSQQSESLILKISNNLEYLDDCGV